MTRRPILCAALALALPLTAFAQSKEKADDRPAPPPHTREMYPAGTDCSTLPNRSQQSDCNYELSQTRIVRLNNVSQQNDANEILVAVRNMADPSLKVYLIASENVIVLSAYPQELDRLEAFIRKLDMPRRSYRLLFTITESDAGKRIGVEHFAFTADVGQRATLKQGSKVPVATGSYSMSDKTSQEQFTYLDVGMNFDATLTQTGPNLVMKCKVEQSSIAESQLIGSVREPVIRQAVIEAVGTIVPGKPTTLSSIDVSGSTRHLDIEVVAEPL